MNTTVLGPTQSWRLIHDGISVLMLDEISGITETIHTAFEAQTANECVIEAKRLGLLVPDNLTELFSIDPRETAKAARATAVGNIKVTTTAGNTFDGDETSQTRMSRAILVLSTGAAQSVPWVLANNTVIQATAAELTEALALAGASQAALWVIN